MHLADHVSYWVSTAATAFGDTQQIYICSLVAA